ncbi:MAG: zinc-ribbon domain-containing protein [Proteobacteria bacterium]|nr:zinc-ribbon domain-containing protein [Pseudomonadota bacterium]
MIQTHCPECGTTFRVTPEQLKAKQGKVRCGECQHVFNALETLHDAMTAPAAPIESEPEFEAMADSVADIPEDVPVEPAPVIEAQDEIPWEEVEPRQVEEIEAQPRRRAWPWVLASVLALMMLTLQLTMQYRVELSVLAPTMKPLLLALCQPFDCDVPLPHVGDLVSIEASDLHPDARQKDQLILAATLKNRAPFAQAYPHLELTLTDTFDKAILRRVLLPAEYLAADVNSAKGFVANSEIAVNLALCYDGSAPATGYRLYLFYP